MASIFHHKDYYCSGYTFSPLIWPFTATPHYYLDICLPIQWPAQQVLIITTYPSCYSLDYISPCLSPKHFKGPLSGPETTSDNWKHLVFKIFTFCPNFLVMQKNSLKRGLRLIPKSCRHRLDNKNYNTHIAQYLQEVWAIRQWNLVK